MGRRDACIHGSSDGPLWGAGATITHGRDIRANTSLVGLKVATTRTVAGYQFDTLASVSSFGANLTGTGTLADPYTIDRVLFTNEVFFTGTALTAKWFKFTNCQVRASGSTTTEGGSSFIGTSFAGGNGSNAPAGLILEDCTLGTGNAYSAGGKDKGVQANCPLRVTRCDISSACIPYYVADSQSSAASWCLDSYIHDLWGQPAVDHTDIINGNPSASHVEVSRCYLNGNRWPGTQVAANAFGIYNDNGNITDWTIDANYVENAATGILSTTSTTAFVAPFVVTNNVFDTSTIGNLSSCRSPSTGSGNVDQNGSPITI